MRPLHFFLTLLATLITLTASAKVQPVELRCESSVAPLGVDSPATRLSWQMRSDVGGDGVKPE